MSNILERLRLYAGKERRDVTNPCITAREAIEVANHIVALEQPCNCELVVHLRGRIAALEAEIKIQREKLDTWESWFEATSKILPIARPPEEQGE